MSEKEEILKKAIDLNEDEKYHEVDDLLTDGVLKKYNDVALYVEKANSLWKLNNIKQLEIVVKLGLKIDNKSSYLKYHLGNIFYKKNIYAKAIELYKLAIQINPNDFRFYIGLGNVYYDNDEFEEAKMFYKISDSVKSENISSIIGLANIYNVKNEYEKAIELYNKAIKIDSNDEIVYYNLGLVYSKKKDYKNAIFYYNKAIKINPKDESIYLELGRVYLEIKDYTKSIENYKKAIDLSPKDYKAYYNLGIVYIDINDFDKAISYLNKSKRINRKEPSIFFVIGTVYQRIKNYEKALEHYYKAIELGLKNISVYSNIAIIMFEKKEYLKAKEYLIKYIEVEKEQESKNNYQLIDAAKSILEIVNNILESNQYENINNILIKIKKILLFKNDCVTHYTGISIAKSLIIDETFFRLSEGTFLNDTSEGIVLFNFLNFASNFENKFSSIATFFSKKPFIGSFVNKTKNNDLTLWRMYGKENLEEAKGCALTINVKELKENIRLKIVSENKELAEFNEIEFYRVVYFNDGNFFISEASNEEINEFNELMVSLKNEITKFEEKKDKNSNEKIKIVELLNQIAYLFKNSEYQYENEVRIVMKDAIGFEKKVDVDFTPPKVYVELVSIVPMIKEITIGPKVERADEWAAAFHYHFLKKDLKPEISISNLPFK